MKSLAVGALFGASLGAANAAPEPAAQAAPETFSVHAQFTNVTQKHPAFASPYAGPNSLAGTGPAAETTDLTLFLGARPWTGGELYINPEIDQGYGLSGTYGVAGFPSGEAYKVGNWSPYGRIQRAFLRQTFALGEARSPVEAGPNQLGGSQPDERLTLTLGKFSVVDLFDNNGYAHDPRGDFLNWALADSAPFDYAADAWGYTLGAALEWTGGDWSLRGGFFALSTEPNSEHIDTGFGQNAVVLEAERRWRWGEHPGTLRLLGWVDHGRMGRYDDALALAATTATAPDTGLVRRMARKVGATLNAEQELATGIGWFARLGANDGRYEAFDFTDVNRSVASGLAIDGARWNRAGDSLGLALVRNALQGPGRAYLAAGGLGLLIGDGRLPRYADERIVEAYYALQLGHGVSVTADYQRVNNPGYNPERGPVDVYGLRLHAAF